MNGNTKRTMLAIVGAMILGSAIITSCKKDDDAKPVTQPSYTVTGNASNSQVYPVLTDTTLAGSGTFNGTYNPNTKVLTYTNTWAGLSGAPTGGGFYNGAMGASGTAVGTPWTYASGTTGTGSYSGTMTLTADQATQLNSGNWYYGYNTAANTGGEVRGQLTSTQMSNP